MPMIGRGDHHGVDGRIMENVAVVARRLWLVADAIAHLVDRSIAVAVKHVADRGNLHHVAVLIQVARGIEMVLRPAADAHNAKAQATVGTRYGSSGQRWHGGQRGAGSRGSQEASTRKGSKRPRGGD